MRRGSGHENRRPKDGGEKRPTHVNPLALHGGVTGWHQRRFHYGASSSSLRFRVSSMPSAARAPTTPAAENMRNTALCRVQRPDTRQTQDPAADASHSQQVAAPV